MSASKSDQPLTAADYQAMGAFRHALRRFARFSAAAARAVD
jgi:hypothetical protein